MTGPKMLPTNSVPLRWTRNRRDQDPDGNGNDHRREGWGVDLQAFDGAEHRDGRGDHAVTIEQRGSDQAYDEQGGTRAALRCVPCVEKRKQRHNAALAAIVGAQDQDGIFEPDDQEKRPDDQRDDAHHRFGRWCAAGADGLLQPVERAGADVAVDDTECRQHGNGWQLPGMLQRPPLGLKDVGHADVPSFPSDKYAMKLAR
jgi:hypothetical protein